MSRALTETEMQYSQIKKELLAVCFAVEKFHYNIYGRRIDIFTDHKPFLRIMQKPLSELTLRIQKMKMRLLPYKLNFNFIKGKNNHIADHLSRYYNTHTESNTDFMEEQIHYIRSNFKLSEEKMNLIKMETSKDKVLMEILQAYRNGWPKLKSDEADVKYFYALEEDIYEENGILYFKNKMIIPRSLISQILNKLHEPHLEMEKTKMRARMMFF